MPNYKTKFNKNWIKTFPWARDVHDDIHKAYCKVCKCEFKVSVGGISSLKQHHNAAKHKSIALKKASLKQNSTGIHSHNDYSILKRRFNVQKIFR